MESIFNQVFTLCSDIEIFHNDNKNKILYRLFGYKVMTKQYKDIKESIKIIKTFVNAPLEIVTSDYIDSMITSNHFIGHCRGMNVTNIPVFRYAITSKTGGTYKVFVYLERNNRNNIFCKFEITDGKDKHVVSFDTPFAEINYNEDISTQNDFEQICSLSKSKLIEILREDIYNYLNEFISDSEERVKNKNERSKVNSIKK